MIEIVPGSLEPIQAPTPPRTNEPQTLGPFTLQGEIVDSKCYLGAMKPGNLKPHRSYAIRCISGGVPPVFLVRDQGGSAFYFLLTDSGGEPANQKVLDFVAKPLHITGEIEKRDNLFVLKADPETYRRIR